MSTKPTSSPAQVCNVSKSFGNKKALDNISVELHSGEILAILGPNGAGKTTLINLMLGRLSRFQGKITLFGCEPRDIRVRRLTGAMLQVAALPNNLTVKEHLQLFSSYYPSPMDYFELIELAGLTAIERCYSQNLSGGQKQRLLLAIAICGRPKLLFLDEPSVGLDVTSRHALWRCIKQLQKEGTAMVLTTHYLEEADQLSDRIVMLNDGKIITQGTPAEIKLQASFQKIRFSSAVPLHQFAGLKGVSDVVYSDNLIEIQTQDSIETLRQVMGVASDLTNLSVSGAALEDAFLKINQPASAVQPRIIG